MSVIKCPVKTVVAGHSDDPNLRLHWEVLEETDTSRALFTFGEAENAPPPRSWLRC